MTTEITSHICFPEPKLSFHPDRPTDQASHALLGLRRFGPYSAGLIPDPINIATISPCGESNRLFDFMKKLAMSHTPVERKGYLPGWPGFKELFNVRMVGAAKDCHLELDKAVDSEFEKSQTPHVVLAEQIGRAIHEVSSRRSKFDVLFVYLPQRWTPGFKGGLQDDFDLHDFLKAKTAAMGIPLQLVREDKAVSYGCVASVMWRLGLAIYAKAGGVPWKLAESDPETAYIGISYALRPVESNRPRFVTCCSQVFDADGAGLEFIAFDAQEFDVQRENPFLSQTEMFRLMTRSLELYRRRHPGRSPRRVMVHKTTAFKEGEIDGCMEALHLCEAVDLVQIVQDVTWRAAKIDGRPGQKKGSAANFPVSRGTLIDISPREALLWTHGSVEGIVESGHYFQGSRSTPRPIKLVRHAGHGTWDDTARSILALTKMDWNNDSLYDPLPVTIGYSQVLARVVKRMSGLGTTPYQFRFFM